MSLSLEKMDDRLSLVVMGNKIGFDSFSILMQSPLKQFIINAYHYNVPVATYDNLIYLGEAIDYLWWVVVLCLDCRYCRVVIYQRSL